MIFFGITCVTTSSHEFLKPFNFSVDTLYLYNIVSYVTFLICLHI